MGEVSHPFCPVSFRYQLISAGESSAWTPARCWGQDSCAKLSPLALTTSYSLCPEGICRSCSDLSPKSLLERATSKSRNRGIYSPRGVLLGFQGYYPRITAGPAPRKGTGLPGVGHSMGGRLLTTGAEQQLWCFFASVINHKDTGKVYSSSKQAVSQSRRRRRKSRRGEMSLLLWLFQCFLWKGHKPGEVFASIPSPELLQQSPGAAASKGRGRWRGQSFLLSPTAKLQPGRRSCLPEKPVSPACLCFLLS